MLNFGVVGTPLKKKNTYQSNKRHCRSPTTPHLWNFHLLLHGFHHWHMHLLLHWHLHYLVKSWKWCLMLEKGSLLQMVMWVGISPTWFKHHDIKVLIWSHGNFGWTVNIIFFNVIIFDSRVSENQTAWWLFRYFSSALLITSCYIDQDWKMLWWSESRAILHCKQSGWHVQSPSIVAFS